MKKTILGLMPLLVASMLIAGCGKKAESSAPASSSEAPSSSSEAVVYTAEKVAADMNANFAAAGYSLELEYDEDHEEWGIAIKTGTGEEADEATLKNSADILASYLPSYMVAGETLYDDPASEDFIDIFGIGIATFNELFDSPDEAVAAQVIGYSYNGNELAQISIWDVEAEQLILKLF